MKTTTLAAAIAGLATLGGLPPTAASAGMDPFIGEIMIVGFNFCPRGWAPANGQLLPISSNTALFSLLGTQYGGDGRTTFALPDLRGRVPINVGQGPGLSNYQMGQRGGAETVTLSTGQMPPHTHAVTGTVNAVASPGNSPTPQGNLNAVSTAAAIYAPLPAGASTVPMANGTVSGTAGSAGAGQPVPNVQPYLAVNICIALQGIFPSRN